MPIARLGRGARGAAGADARDRQPSVRRRSPRPPAAARGNRDPLPTAAAGRPARRLRGRRPRPPDTVRIPTPPRAAPEPVRRPDRGRRARARAARLPGLVVRPEPGRRHRHGDAADHDQRDDRRRDDHERARHPWCPSRSPSPGNTGVDRRRRRLPARQDHRAQRHGDRLSTTRRPASGPTVTPTRTFASSTCPGCPTRTMGPSSPASTARRRSPWSAARRPTSARAQGSCSSVPTTRGVDNNSRAVDGDRHAVRLTSRRRRATPARRCAGRDRPLDVSQQLALGDGHLDLAGRPRLTTRTPATRCTRT